MIKSGRLFDILAHQAREYPQEKAISDLFDGTFRHFSISDIENQSNQIARGIQALDLSVGDKIGLVVQRNRAEFTLLDIAIQKCGMVSVPLYASISINEYTYILKESGCKCIFFGGGDLAEKLIKVKSKLPALQFLFSLDRIENTNYWKDIWSDASDAPLDVSKIDPTQLMTIIYTSGTTGHPKGVMLSHHNILENIYAVIEVMPLGVASRVMSFLPLCHIFERTASFAYLLQGVQIIYSGIDNLGGDEGDLRRVRPHFFTCVPRLLEKVYEKIYERGLALPGWKKKLFFWALDLTDDYHYDKVYTGMASIKRKLADRLVYSKWRDALGREVKGILTASAPCPVKIARVFSAAGIPVREAYGLTESSPGLAINGLQPGMAMLGTVGPPLSNVEIMIDQQDPSYGPGEGEILAAGPNIMMGYYNKPEESKAVLPVIDGKTWLRTGDIGKMVKNPKGNIFLKITDRKKELLKTSTGKYVAPAPIENKLKEHILIEQAMVVGDGHKFAAAIIAPSHDALHRYCQQGGMDGIPIGEMLTQTLVLQKIGHIVASVNEHLARHEQIKKFELVPDIWSMSKANGTNSELTPTLKLKRRVLRDKYADLISKIYA